MAIAPIRSTIFPEKFRPFHLMLLLVLLFTQAGCAAIVRQDQPQSSDQSALEAGHTIGQTFVAQHAGLEGFQVLLSPQIPGDGKILLHLRSDALASQDLAVSQLSISQVKKARYYSFHFDPITGSRRQYYYAFLELQGNGAVQVGRAPGVTYLDGALYRDSAPLDGQMTFGLMYNREQALLDLAKQMLRWIVILLIAAALFVLPGWAVFNWTFPGWDALTWAEKLGLSAGLSLALYPLLLLWTSLIGLHLGAVYAWAPPAIAILAIAWRNRTRLPQAVSPVLRLQPGSIHLSFLLRRDWNWQTLLPDLALLVCAALLFWTRFWALHSLEAPMWGDSVQHTLISQLIVNHGGLFSSWQPYTDLTTFTYHFGFHSVVAVFDWITHFDLPRATLWMGQIVNSLAVLTIYPLATKLGRSRWAGVGAVLVAGLLAPMPMAYINMGRYTQLAGQVILPVAITLLWSLAEQEKVQKRHYIPAMLAMGGLALAHYRILIFAILFLPALFLLYSRIETLKSMVKRIFWTGLGAGLLFLPWFIHLYGGKILGLLKTQLTTSPKEAPASWVQQSFVTQDMTVYLPALVWMALILAIAWGLWKREKGVALISLWWSLIILASYPDWLGLPGSGALTGFTQWIAIYIPAGVLIGAALGWLAGRGESKQSRGEDCNYIQGHLRLAAPRPYSPYRYTITNLALFAAVLVLALAGARQRPGDLTTPTSAMVTRPDVRAAVWIRENTPADAKFLVNSFFAYENSLIVGSDAGWWLPVLAGRQVSVPPINYSSEEGPTPDYRDQVNLLTREIQQKGINSPDVLSLLKERGIHYVYLGQRQGIVNNYGSPILDPKQLASSPNYRLLYHQDRTWVFAVASK